MGKTVTAKMHSLICHNIKPSFQDKQAQELDYNCLQIAMSSKKNKKPVRKPPARKAAMKKQTAEEPTTEEPKLTSDEEEPTTQAHVRENSLFLTYHQNHPNYNQAENKPDKHYKAHWALMPHSHIHEWSKANDYPFRPSHDFYWDALAGPVKKDKEPRPLKGLMEKFNKAKVVEWNPDNPISYHNEQLTAAQKQVLSRFATPGNDELTAYDITMAASCVQVYFDLIHKANFGSLQFRHTPDKVWFSKKTQFLLKTLADRTFSQLRDVIYWLARIMAHRDYYFDSNDSKHYNKKTYAAFDEGEKERFDHMIDIFVEITPVVIINEFTKPGEFRFVDYVKDAHIIHKKSPPKIEDQKKYMQRVDFDAVRQHFRELGNANAISTRYLGERYYYTTGRHQNSTDFLWECIEYPDPCLGTNNSHDKKPEATKNLKEYKWDKDIKMPITKTTKGGKKTTKYKTMPLRKIYKERKKNITGKQALEAWAKTTILLPIAIIFNKLQGWRNDNTTQATSFNRGKDKTTGVEQSSHNRVYDYRFITPAESKMLAQDFPSCIDPSLIEMKKHAVPLTNEQKAAQQQEQQQQQPQSNNTQSGKNTNNKKRKTLEQVAAFPADGFNIDGLNDSDDDCHDKIVSI